MYDIIMYLTPLVVARPSWKCVNRPGCIIIQPFLVDSTEQFCLLIKSYVSYTLSVFSIYLNNYLHTLQIYNLRLQSQFQLCLKQC